MSIKNNDSLCDSDIFNRVRIVARIKSDKEFAELLGISGVDFAQRKKRGTLLPLITKWAINQDIDLNYLLRGTSSISVVGLDPDPRIASLMEGARRVLTSGNVLAFHALEQNIMYFDHAIAAEKRADEMEKKIEEMKEDFSLIKEEMQRLRRENLRLDMEEEAQLSERKVA